MLYKWCVGLQQIEGTLHLVLCRCVQLATRFVAMLVLVSAHSMERTTGGAQSQQGDGWWWSYQQWRVLLIDMIAYVGSYALWWYSPHDILPMLILKMSMAAQSQRGNEVLGKLGPRQSGPGQLGPGAQLSRAQFATFTGRTVGPRTIGPEPIWLLWWFFWWFMNTFCNSRWHFNV